MKQHTSSREQHIAQHGTHAGDMAREIERAPKLNKEVENASLNYAGGGFKQERDVFRNPIFKSP